MFDQDAALIYRDAAAEFTLSPLDKTPLVDAESF
jgi:hypothetical protein